MIEINEKNIKMWSTIGPRATLGLVLNELADKIDNLMVLTSDVSTSAGLDRFRKTHKLKYLDVGIAEQNLIGVASGLSSEGFNVLTTTFAPFQTLRCCEQIKVNLGYMKNKICMVGIASGVVLGNLGYTHCCIEDIGVLRSIPNISIVSPSDCLELVKILEVVFTDLNNSIYIRLTGGSNHEIINKANYNFEIGKAIQLVEGDDITIFSCGSVLGLSLAVSNIISKNYNIRCGVVNMHTIKPIDRKKIEEKRNSKLLVSIEEHNIIGGLGSAIADELVNYSSKAKLLKFGISDEYTGGGDYKFMLEINGLSTNNIVEKIINNYN